MSTTEANERIAVTAILAKLILLRHEKQLPEPVRLDTYSSWLTIEFGTPVDRDAWRDAIGGDFIASRPCTFENGNTRHELEIDDWHGWDIHLYTDIRPAAEVDSGLDAETVAALESAAAS